MICFGQQVQLGVKCNSCGEMARGFQPPYSAFLRCQCINRECSDFAVLYLVEKVSGIVILVEGGVNGEARGVHSAG